MPYSATEPHLSFLKRLPLSSAAVDFATACHAGQRRPADDAAFLMHPLEVAALLERSGYPDRVVAAAVLHDVLENTDTERPDLERRFGREVAELVDSVSDDPTIGDEERRKDDTRERVRRDGGYAAAVYAADKISKVRELRMMLARGGGDESLELKHARYRHALEMLDEVLPGSRLVEVLRFELEALEELPPAGTR